MQDGTVVKRQEIGKWIFRDTYVCFEDDLAQLRAAFKHGLQSGKGMPQRKPELIIERCPVQTERFCSSTSLSTTKASLTRLHLGS